jgi:hypothetical protein
VQGAISQTLPSPRSRATAVVGVATAGTLVVGTQPAAVPRAAEWIANGGADIVTSVVSSVPLDATAPAGEWTFTVAALVGGASGWAIHRVIKSRDSWPP